MFLNYILFSKLCRPLSQTTFGTQNSMAHWTRVPTGPKAWYLAVPQIFVLGLSQRYLSQSQASQENQSQSQSQVPDLCPGTKSPGIPVPLPIPFFIYQSLLEVLEHHRNLKGNFQSRRSPAHSQSMCPNFLLNLILRSKFYPIFICDVSIIREKIVKR